MPQISRGVSPSRRRGACVLLAGLAGCLACTGCGATTGKTDGAAGAGANGSGGAAGARDAGPDASAGGAAGASVRDAGDDAVVTTAVRGFVQDNIDVPIAGAHVRIGSTTVEAAADGSFEIDGVVPPYDLDVWATTTTMTYATLVARYVGLTRVDPTVHLYDSITPPHQAALSVTFSAPLPSGDAVNCQFANPVGSEAMGQAAGGPIQGGTVSITVGWYTSATSISGTLSCLVYKNSVYTPTGFDGFASLPVTLTDRATTPAMLTLAPVSTGTLMVGVTLGSATSVAVYGDVLLPGGAAHPIGVTSAITSNPTSILIPQIAGATLLLNALGSATSVADLCSTRSGFPVSTASIQLSLPAPIAAISPADGATMVDTGTVLSWSAPAGAAVNVSFYPDDLNNAELNVYTTRSSATIPDLTAQGVLLPTGAGYNWHVMSYGTSVSVDDIASPAGFPCNSDLPGNCDWSQTEPRAFTLQ